MAVHPRGSDVTTDVHVPPPYPRIADMPPPGSARRRLLREFGIRISLTDFTDEELALSGIDPPDV